MRITCRLQYMIFYPIKQTIDYKMIHNHSYSHMQQTSLHCSKGNPHNSSSRVSPIQQPQVYDCLSGTPLRTSEEKQAEREEFGAI